MNALKLTLGIAILTIFATSCTSVSSTKKPGVSLSDGYRSARLVESSQHLHDNGSEGSAEVHNAIQRSIRNQFKTRGLLYGVPNADLVVAYMLIRQENGATTMNADHFGQGRNANAIVEEARQRGIIKNNQPQSLKSGTLVIDIIDAKTNKLIFRNQTTRELIGGVKPVQRSARINEAIAQTLAPFF